MIGFLVGTIAGGMAAYFWHDRIRSYVSHQMPAVRDRAAERLGQIGERASTALDRARDRIDTTVRTGQERLKATGTAGRGESGSGLHAPGGSTADRTTGTWPASGTSTGHTGSSHTPGT
jgi:hypothetical protein